MTRRKPLTLNAGRLEQLPDNGAVAGFAGTRQTVLQGSVDSNGFPNALSIGSGLAVTLTATGTAFLLSFVAGWDSNGAIDYLSQFTTNQSFSSLTASTTCFLYVDRDISTGALTTGFTTISPVYQTAAPASPATGQHWFDLATFTLKRWSGSVWVVFQRVFVGECATGASTATSVITYAYCGAYQSLWVAVTSNTTYLFNHNLGLALSHAVIGVFSSIAGNDGDAVPAVHLYNAGTDYYGFRFLNNGSQVSRRNVQITMGFIAQNSAGTWLTSGASYQLRVRRNW